MSSPEMPFFDHLDELRMRLMKCLYIFLAGFIFSYFVTNPWVFEFLRKPLFEVLPPDQQKLYFTSLFENFLTHLKIAGYSAIILFCPFYFYQIWAFIAPGLHSHERGYVLPFLVATAVFFIGGALFAYYVLFPVGFKFFVTYGGPTDVPLLTIESYYGTCMKLMLLFGLAFEFPVLICLFGFLGMVDSKMLRAHRRTAVLGIAVASAVFAPPDAISMLILMAPLILMYEGAIWVVHWLGIRRKTRKDLAERNKPKDSDNTGLTGKSQ